MTATGREFMLCTWPQIRMERIFLKLVQKKLTSISKFPPLNQHKTLNSLIFVPPLKFQKKSWKRGRGGGGGNYGYSSQLKWKYLSLIKIKCHYVNNVWEKSWIFCGKPSWERQKNPKKLMPVCSDVPKKAITEILNS